MAPGYKLMGSVQLDAYVPMESLGKIRNRVMKSIFNISL